MDVSWTEEQYNYKLAVIGFAQNELNEGQLEHDLWDANGGTIYSGISDIHCVVNACWFGL